MMRSPAIVAALAIGLAATSALAPQAAQAQQATVKLGDLDLSRASDARAALARVTRAAGEVCGDQRNVEPELIRLSDTFQRCRSETVAAAVAKIPGAAIARAYADSRHPPLQLAGR